MELIKRMSDHVKNNKSVYLQAGIMAAGAIVLSPDTTIAAGIDVGGQRIYSKLISIGKWVIIIKGGIDIIQTVSNGDFESARKHFMQYLLIYGTLFALPWGLDEIEGLFRQ
jgi:hypothetical protein